MIKLTLKEIYKKVNKQYKYGVLKHNLKIKKIIGFLKLLHLILFSLLRVSFQLTIKKFLINKNKKSKIFFIYKILLLIINFLKKL